MQCDHSLESYWKVLSCGTVCFVIQCGSDLLVCGSNHAVWPFFGKLLKSTFMWYCLFRDTVWFLLLQRVECCWVDPSFRMQTHRQKHKINCILLGVFKHHHMTPEMTVSISKLNLWPGLLTLCGRGRPYRRNGLTTWSLSYSSMTTRGGEDSVISGLPYMKTFSKMRVWSQVGHRVRWIIPDTWLWVPNDTRA